jgi:hypothetical protein
MGIIINFLLASLISSLSLGIIFFLTKLGNIDVYVENSWLKAGGVLAAFIVLYLLIKRTVFLPQTAEKSSVCKSISHHGELGVPGVIDGKFTLRP